MKKAVVAITTMLALATAQGALAEGSKQMMHDMHGSVDAENTEHEHMNMQGMEHGNDHMQGNISSGNGMFLKKKEIDGYTVSFHVMKAKEGMQHGGSHNFMAKVKKDGKALTDLVVNSKVKYPNGTSESKMLMKMGDWYMAGYDLGHEGIHQLMVLFKTSDGINHFIGAYYPENKHQYHDEQDAQESE